MDDKYLIIGLGNPGRQYRKNRHNTGFMLIDRFAETIALSFSRLQGGALIAQGDYETKKVILAKPQTFMNLSGKAALSLVKFYKMPLDNVIIIHDDLDLPLGTLRIRPDGGSGGQKGIHSVLVNLGTDQFPRIRMGIGRPPGNMEAPDYVLKNFNPGETPLVEDMLMRGVGALREWIKYGLSSSMNIYNSKNQDNFLE